MTPKSLEFIYIGNLPSSDRGSLKGLRLGVKDLFDVAGIPTSAGNPDWLATHAIPEETAPSVAALLDAGATFIDLIDGLKTPPFRAILDDRCTL